MEFSGRRVWLERAGGCGRCAVLPGRAGTEGRCPAPSAPLPPRRVLTRLVPSRDFQLSLKFKVLIILAANPVTNRSDFVFPLLPRLDLLCLSYRTIGLRSKCYSGLIPYPGIYFDCPFSLALLIFNRSPFPVKSPLCSPGLASSRSCFHPVWVGPPERCPGSHDPLPPRLRDGASPGGTPLHPRAGDAAAERRERACFKQPELPAQRLNFSPPAEPLLYPKKNSASGASGGAGRRDPHGPGAGRGGGRESRGA